MTGRDCPVCGDGFTSASAVRDHAWDAHDACHHCGDAFGGQEALYAHWLAVHGDDLSRMDRKRAWSAVGSLSVGQRLAHGGVGAALSGASVDRRTLVRGGAASLVAGTTLLAGRELLGGQSADGGTSLATHPSAADVERQPTLGPAPSESGETIVAFEDPSCPSCGRFERETFPTLETRLVEEEDVSFVFRGVPLVGAWGNAATRDAVLAMEATYARDAAAFWSLKAFYYRVQGELGSGNVHEETRRFLREETDVDAAAVLSDVERGVQSDAVDADVTAARDAGVQATPTFFLFRDGSFVTEVRGAQSTDVFADALGV